MLIGVVTAIRPETRTVLRALSGVQRVRDGQGSVWRGKVGGADVVVLQSGVGLARAEAATKRFVAPPDLIVSVGFAGALRERVEVGTLVVSTRVVWEDTSGCATYEVAAPLVSSLRHAAKGPTIEGPLLSSPIVLSTPAEKAAAGARYGAAAVEMEGAALVRYAEDHGIPFLPVRAVLDPMELSLDDLPSGIASSWSARARLLAAPGLWPTLRLLRANAAAAATVLGPVCKRVLAGLAAPA